MPRRRERLSDLCCDDKATLFLFILGTISFVVTSSGLICYFYQYDFGDDRSDERWIYPFIWLVPCVAWLTGLGIQLSATFKKPRLLLLLPILAVINILLHLFLCYIFYKSNQIAMKEKICRTSKANQDKSCVVSKDGHQICGHAAIGALCLQIELGFYLLFMGAILMAGTQILLVITSCVRRSRIRDDGSVKSYIRLSTQVSESL
eukprot:TRINITY_DN1167_c0_g1_i1.p1 TRINITY_DN1167_c0_g1~~TRINITY_DN1167_c0_g1_i1.p1  ORF type:complete len:205 (-),score=5.65 TRINITY_DN1167_c0_g1_i1:48-662(-)